MSGDTDSTDSWGEILTRLLGAAVLLFGLESGWWWVAHRFAWWTFALTAGGSLAGWYAAREGAKEARKALRERRAARQLGERLLAARRGAQR